MAKRMCERKEETGCARENVDSINTKRGGEGEKKWEGIMMNKKRGKRREIERMKMGWREFKLIQTHALIIYVWQLN